MHSLSPHQIGILCAGILFATVPLPGQSIEYTKLDPNIIQSRLEQYPGDNEARRAALKKIFEEAGCKDGHLTDQKVKGSELGNVVCTIPGQTESVIVVGAHFDKKGSHDGVIDNWTGATMLPSLYQSLVKTPRKHTFVFVGFTDKEKGRKGSKAFVKGLSKQEASQTLAMVNIDSLGLSASKVTATEDNKQLTAYLAGVAKAVKRPVLGQNIENWGSNDSESFQNRKIPCVTLHSLTPDNISVLHSKKDTIEAVQKDNYYDSYVLLAAYLAYLDVKL